MGGKKRRKKKKKGVAPAPAGGWHWITWCYIATSLMPRSVDHFSFLGQKGIISGLVIGKVYAKPARVAFKTPANFLRRETWSESVPLGLRRKSILPQAR